MNLPFADRKFQQGAILVLILACVALVVHEIYGTHGYLALRREQKELSDLKKQIQDLQQQNRDLETQIKALKSDPKAIEKLAREGMGMARPGEIIVALPDKQEKPKDGQAAATNGKDLSPK